MEGRGESLIAVGIVVYHNLHIPQICSNFSMFSTQVFTFTNQSSVNFQLFLRLFQGVLFLGIIAAIVVCIIFTSLTVGDCFAILLAFIPTGWGLLSVSSLTP
jgi:hypothetical protein